MYIPCPLYLNPWWMVDKFLIIKRPQIHQQDTLAQNEGVLTSQLQTERHRSNETSTFHHPTVHS
jgi:hypothetical protein